MAAAGKRRVEKILTFELSELEVREESGSLGHLQKGVGGMEGWGGKMGVGGQERAVRKFQVSRQAGLEIWSVFKREI